MTEFKLGENYPRSVTFDASSRSLGQIPGIKMATTLSRIAQLPKKLVESENGTASTLQMHNVTA